MSATPGWVWRRRAISSRDLVARELAALAGLRSLGDLDLELVGKRGILRRDPEAGRCDLLDPRVALGPEAGRVLAPLARVRAGAEPVQRDRERSCASLLERSVRHRAAREPLDDCLDRLDLVERHGLPVGDQLEKIARLERLPVDGRGLAKRSYSERSPPATARRRACRSHGLVERASRPPGSSRAARRPFDA